MQYITTTGLRTKSAQLVQSLKRGTTFSLIYRSKVIGLIQPSQLAPISLLDIKSFATFLKTIRPGKAPLIKHKEANYKRHLKQRYGQDLP